MLVSPDHENPLGTYLPCKFSEDLPALKQEALGLTPCRVHKLDQEVQACDSTTREVETGEPRSSLVTR